jgi:hypothetical protein
MTVPDHDASPQGHLRLMSVAQLVTRATDILSGADHALMRAFAPTSRYAHRHTGTVVVGWPQPGAVCTHGEMV